MSNKLFESLVESTERNRPSRVKYFTVVSVLWTLSFGLMIVMGIGTVNAVLEVPETAILVAQPPVALGKPDVPNVRQPAGTQKPTGQPSPYVAVREAPKEISIKPSGPPMIPVASSTIGDPSIGVPGMPNGVPNGMPHGVPDGVPSEKEAPPPPPPLVATPQKPEAIVASPVSQQPVRKSGGVLAGSATKRVEPIYPPLAKAARVSGSVIVEVTVDEFGGVISARALSGHPLLKDAAITASRGWKFTPTKLSGQAVKVVGTITFNFNL